MTNKEWTVDIGRLAYEERVLVIPLKALSYRQLHDLWVASLDTDAIDGELVVAELEARESTNHGYLTDEPGPNRA